MICTSKHTTFQPTNAQWRCPACDADNSDFVIDEHADGVPEDCDKLHAGDTVHCYRCQRYWTGTRIASLLARTYNRVPCPTCKGCGTVDA